MDQQVYAKALARAKAEGIRIVGQSALDGNRSWVVENPAHDGHYIVRLAAGAKELTCNCPARTLCKHRALVHEALEREAARLARGMWGSGDGGSILALQSAHKAALAQPSIWS